jgi:hypothetical protein
VAVKVGSGGNKSHLCPPGKRQFGADSSGSSSNKRPVGVDPIGTLGRPFRGNSAIRD